MIPGFIRNQFILFAFIFSCICTKAQIKAAFTATPKNGCAPLVVNFTDLSLGNPKSWKWDLGNGTISYLQNPSAIYFNPGKYPVRLLVKNANDEDSVIKTDFIEVYASPEVNFSVDKTTGCYPLDVQFKDLTQNTNGSLNSWLWDFGDGNTAAVQDPAHTYVKENNFNVTLQVKNSNGCVAVYTKTSAIEINNGVISSFTNSTPKTCTAPVTINFQNNSTGTGSIGYEWNFGDGFTSTLTNPSHTYTNIGTYTVSLVTINEKGCSDTLTKANAVTVGQVKAAISVNDVICENTPTQITDASSPHPATVMWYFGDGTTTTNFNPIKNYKTHGSYTLKLVANFGACTDSAIKTISVLPKPSATFSAVKTSSCISTFTTDFKAQGSGIINYSWDFGDSSFATGANVSHTYTNWGSYTVKLIVTNSNGCTDTIVQKDYIKIEKPTIVFDNLPDSGCVPFSKQFNTTIHSLDAISGYTWNFGDGNSSNAASPVHQYTDEGVYPVSLTIITASGCTVTDTLQRAIITNNKPIVKFLAAPLSSCAKDTISFTDSSGTGNSRWLWDFGDGAFSPKQNPVHNYIDTGMFDVQLTLWKGGCADSLKIKDYLYIKPPIAKFTITSSCTLPYQRSFNDFSIGADEYHWDFGDGQNSDQQNPTHIYTNPGIYTTMLRVVNNTSGCDYVTSSEIKIVDPVLDFTSKDTAICKGSTAIFTTSLSLDDIAVFNWNFGDGSAASNSNNGSNSKEHVFNRLGSFDITLITTDVNGCKDTLSKSAYITVSGANAKFGLSVTGTCINNTVQFFDSTITDGVHPIKNWVWDYGDGKKDSLNTPPFAHIYTKTGSYPVSLTVYNGDGCKDSYRLTAPVEITKPVAGFSTPDTASCPGKQIRFISQSAGSGLSYVWNFGDNSSDTASNPSHQYLVDATYSVKLVITDKYGCTDSIKQLNYITISTPAAYFLISDSVTNCPPLITTLTDRSANAVSRLWDFGDNTYSTEIKPIHFYNFAGKYTITLTVTGNGGCTSVYKKIVDVKGPQGTFAYTAPPGCNPVSLNFSSATDPQNKVLWDFNDGNVISNSTLTVKHSYLYPGSYLPKMILIDQFGCKVPIPGKDTIKVSGVNTNFSFIAKLLCDSGIVAFKDSSIAINDVIANYKWIFGDGNISASKNPSYQYNVPGIYYPKLIVTTSVGCSDTATSSIPVKVVSSPKIDMVFSGNGCVPLKASFSSKILKADTSSFTWKWNFANGITDNTPNPVSQTYTKAGIYNVTLTATNSSGCQTVILKPVEAYAIPKVYAGNDTLLCKGSSLTLTATGANSYAWSPSTNLLCTNCASTITNTPNNITYYVIGTSVHGCIAKDTIKINVKDKFVLKHSPADSLCRGESKQLSASGAYAYTWSPAASMDNASIDNPTVKPDTSIMYRVIAIDDKGCFRDTAYIPIKVNQLPTVEAGDARTINVGSTIELVPIVSDDVITAEWQPTSGVFRNFFPGITVKPKENTEYTVEVKNRGGCKARDKVTVFVICNGANIFVPNTFSPNNDGVNDIFYPRGTGLFKIKNIKIFNRWGVLVFEKTNFNANNPADGWNGRNKGIELNPDIFVYSLEVMCDNGSVLNYNGNIALIK